MTLSSKSRLGAGVPEAIRHEQQEFIEVALRKEDIPWRQPNVRDDLDVALNTRVSERTAIMLTWFSDKMGVPKKGIVEEAIKDWVKRQSDRFRLPDG